MIHVNNLSRWAQVVWGVVALLAASAFVLQKHRGSHVPGNSIDPPYVPYTVVRSSQSVDGSRTVLTTFALSGDYIEILKNRKRDADYRGQSVKRTVATATGLIIRIDDVAELKSTVFDPKGTNRIRLGDRRYDCMKTSGGAPLRFYEQRVIRKEHLGGYETIVVKGDKSTRWHAPALNCAVLQMRADFGQQITEDQFVSIAAGEPLPGLMAVPAHYKEVTPSGLSKTASTLTDDKYYHAHRPPAELMVGAK